MSNVTFFGNSYRFMLTVHVKGYLKHSLSHYRSHFWLSNRDFTNRNQPLSPMVRFNHRDVVRYQILHEFGLWGLQLKVRCVSILSHSRCSWPNLFAATIFGCVVAVPKRNFSLLQTKIPVSRCDMNVEASWWAVSFMLKQIDWWSS